MTWWKHVLQIFQRQFAGIQVFVLFLISSSKQEILQYFETFIQSKRPIKEGVSLSYRIVRIFPNFNVLSSQSKYGVFIIGKTFIIFVAVPFLI